MKKSLKTIATSLPFVREYVREHDFLRAQTHRRSADVLLALMPAPFWAIDDIRIDGSELEMRGWALPPREGAGDALFSIDCEPMDSCEPRLERADIARVFWFVPGAERCGFVCRGTLDESRRSEDPIVLSYGSRETNQPFSPWHNWHWIPPNHKEPAMPSARLCERVHNSVGETTFRIEGASNYFKFNQALNRYFGKNIKAFEHCLDWGCGCGRLSRYFAAHEKTNLTGVDIDPECISWCQSHLTFGEFEKTEINPPLPFRDNAFDLLIGISVFTHLAEPAQNAWLKELSRLTRPGGAALMTIHGPAAWCRSGSSDLAGAVARSKGIFDSGVDARMKDVIEEYNYYRSIFHTHDYIYSRWSRWFDVLDIIPGCVGNHQDLVIMRKR